VKAPSLEPGTHLPAYHVIARNGAKRSDNRIHSDAEARAHGFRGGLVPGITTFSYMIRPVADAFGLSWLDRGRAWIRLRRPVYEGDPLDVRGTVISSNSEGTTIDLVVAGEDQARAFGGATLLAAAPPPMDPSSFARATLPATPPPVSRAALERTPVLGTIEMRYDAKAAPMDEIDDELPLYRDAGVAHPALLLGAANFILASNVALGPWIHVTSEITLMGRVQDGDDVSIRGKVDRLFEKQGREFVELSVLLVRNDRDAVMHVAHTAIYKL
jgi:acyl dehydratase